jgi:hypothetical protein
MEAQDAPLDKFLQGEKIWKKLKKIVILGQNRSVFRKKNQSYL